MRFPECGSQFSTTDTQEFRMRKLINSTYITLDGVIENPMWTMPYFDEEAAASPVAQTTRPTRC